MVGQKVTYNRGEHGLLAISRMLREKNLLGILYDQDTNDDGVRIDLFGKDSVIPMGPAALSLFTVHRFYRYFCTTIQMAPVRLKFILPCTPRKQKTRSRIFML